MKWESATKKDIKAMAISVTIAELMTIPICTIKTNYQNSMGTVVNTIRSIYTKHGVRGFTSASIPAVACQIINSTGKYSSYEYLKRQGLIKLKNPLIDNIKNSVISGLAVSMITHPLDRFRVSWQVGKKISNDLQQHGLGTLYRGISKTLSKSLIGSITYYPIYDFVKCKVEHPSIASLVSAFISTTIIQPVDYMKTCHLNGNLNLRSLLIGGPFNAIRSCYRGYLLNLARILPHFTIMMTLTEKLKKY
jgi:hypothetical protein